MKPGLNVRWGVNKRFIVQDLRNIGNDELNVQLDIFEEHKEDDFAELSHRLTDVQVNFEYPFINRQCSYRYERNVLVNDGRYRLFIKAIFNCQRFSYRSSIFLRNFQVMFEGMDWLSEKFVCKKIL
jgi:hypothetical protein